MKIKEILSNIGVWILVVLVLMVFMPINLLLLLYKLVCTPFSYIQYKRSRYQRDFPHKYKWLDTVHNDNPPYTVIKDHNLPIEYIKWSEDYDVSGYFVYNDVLLDFTEPFFFDKRKGLWLCWQGQEVEEDFEDSDSEQMDDEENTDDCLTVENTGELILSDFHNRTQGYACNRVVFFYRRDHAQKNYEEGGLEKMRELDDFIIYEKDELAEVLTKFVGSN